jgi:hypothetical protein
MSRKSHSDDETTLTNMTPHTAQVHPDEVVTDYSGGWVEDK